MFRSPRAVLFCLLLAAPLPALAVESAAATQWWADISALANDGMKGRLTGTTDYLRAADYVIGRLKAEGLAPAGVNGYLQPVALEQQMVDQAASRAALVMVDGSTTPVAVGDAMIITAYGGPRPAMVDAPLVFIGYGLHLPAQGHDDFAGLDLKGKIAVVLSGGPASISGPIKSNARANRAAELGRMGALGLITLTTPKQVEILWARQKLIAQQPGMYQADRSLRDTPDGFFLGNVDPQKTDLFLAGSGHTADELNELADASKPLPHFALAQRLQASIAAMRTAVTSPNIVARLEGADPALKSEYVVVSAHLDHLGVGEPINGDAIYNGAMDDASGVAAVLDIAHRLKTGPRPRRSILFVLFTAEEKGLLGSHYFVAHPTVPRDSIVADMNFDMPLPLWKLTSVYLPGETESTLGADARAIGAEQGIAVVPDPLPDRNVFIRADQYSFVREGIPALFFKFGFAKGTPEFQIEHDWRATRYHSPSDDLQQPGIFHEDAVKLDAFTAALTLRVANADARPQWLPGSVFAKN